MSQQDKDQWHREIEQLHQRLERLQLQHSETLQAIRRELRALEARMDEAPLLKRLLEEENEAAGNP